MIPAMTMAAPPRRARSRRTFVGALAVACAALLTTARAQDAQPTAEQILARLDAYFDTYRPALGQLVAEERLVQYVARGTGSGVNAIRVTREIHSDVAFIDLPGNAGWLGFRDVRTVSNKNVRLPGPSLAEVLLRSGEDKFEQARALLLNGARHNLGEARTTNLPTLPLELLQQRHRFRYDVRIEGYDKVEGRRTAMVVLDEESTPSLIRRGDGGDLMARVVGWVEADSGQLWRAEVRLEDPRLIFAKRHRPTTLRVHFKMHKELGVIVPDKMEEWFFDSVHGDGFGEGRYKNFRRFDTVTRLVPPPAS
jgi:hypothetical protein